MGISFRCEGCGRVVTTLDSNAGRRGACPSCRHVNRIPHRPGGAAPTPESPGQDELETTCECGHRVTAAPAQAGGRVACPRCGRELILPNPNLDAEIFQRYPDLGGYASNPCGLRAQWFWYHWNEPFLIVATLIAAAVCFSSLAAAGLGWPGWWWVGLPGLLLAWPVWRLAWYCLRGPRDHFMMGNLLPGIVVSDNPMKLAVSTDLTRGEGNWPVVKIKKKRLPKRNGKAAAVGDRVPVVAVYSPPADDDQPFWSNFDPVPVPCGTTDPAQIQYAARRVDDADYAELEEQLGCLPQDPECGLYLIDKESRTSRHYYADLDKHWRELKNNR